MRYEAIVDSHGFRKRYWGRGTIVDVEEHELAEFPAKHFRLIDGQEVKAVEPVKEQYALSEASTQAKIPPTGMAAGFESVNPQGPDTAGKAYKEQQKKKFKK